MLPRFQIFYLITIVVGIEDILYYFFLTNMDIASIMTDINWTITSMLVHAMFSPIIHSTRKIKIGTICSLLCLTIFSPPNIFDSYYRFPFFIIAHHREFVNRFTNRWCHVNLADPRGSAFFVKGGFIQ